MNFDFNGNIPKDKCFSNFTVQCKNICMRSQGLPQQDDICSRTFVENLLNLCGGSSAGTTTSSLTDPQWDAYRQASMRIYSALYQQCQAKDTVSQNNGDESAVPQFIAMFSKALSHDPSGRVIPAAYEQLRSSLVNRNVSNLSSVPIQGSIKFVQPLAPFSLNFIGPSPSQISAPASPSFTSAETAGEMVEVYCQAYARDIPFADYDTEGTVIPACISYLTSLSDYKGHTPVTRANLFRGKGDGDLIGPYISQFFWMETPFWPGSISAMVDYPLRNPSNNRMITEVNYLSVENGTVLESDPVPSGTPTYLAHGRDLAHMVWQDAPGQFYDSAVKKALKDGAAFSPVNPYRNVPLNNNQDPFVTWSLMDALACIYTASQVALSVAWYQKWVVHRRVRPEAFGNEVQQVYLSNPNVAGIHADLLTSGILTDILGINGGTQYLPQAYPEGSPAHPSYPAGHAVLSGACITVMKAFLDEDYVFSSPMQSDASGNGLTVVGVALSLGQECNKLASNVALGRDWAGVHYRTDGHDGILLGEQVGIQILQDWINRYPETNGAFQFKGYLGNSISIFPQNSHASGMQNPGANFRGNFEAPECCGN